MSNEATSAPRKINKKLAAIVTAFALALGGFAALQVHQAPEAQAATCPTKIVNVSASISSIGARQNMVSTATVTVYAGNSTPTLLGKTWCYIGLPGNTPAYWSTNSTVPISSTHKLGGGSSYAWVSVAGTGSGTVYIRTV